MGDSEDTAAGSITDGSGVDREQWWLDVIAAAVVDFGSSLADIARMPLALLLAMNRHKRALDERTDRHWAMMYAMFCNANRNPEKTPTPFSVDDFMPKPARKSAPSNGFQIQPVSEMLAMAHSITSTFKQVKHG